MTGGANLTRLDDIFYRMTFLDSVDGVLDPARSPEGRSHYGGQAALYMSATPEGTAVAVMRYVSPSDAARVVVPLRVRSERVVDLRDAAATRFFGIDVTHRAAEWQDFRARSERSPTWDISDRVRALDLHGMLYASRTDPSKTHLTLFLWNCDNGAEVRIAGAPLNWAMTP